MLQVTLYKLLLCLLILPLFRYKKLYICRWREIKVLIRQHKKIREAEREETKADAKIDGDCIVASSVHYRYVCNLQPYGYTLC